MKIFALYGNPALYTANAYLLLGDWNKIDDVNTLIDCGVDDHVLRELADINTGVGKIPVTQVILTHNHFDHAAGLSAVVAAYAPRVYALAPGPGVTHVLRSAQRVYCADRWCELIPVPGHSDDSLCVYCPEQRVLFSGDMPLGPRLDTPGFPPAFTAAVRDLARRPLELIYPGHGAPLPASQLRF